MNLSQKTELRKLMVPELKQSLKILSLPLAALNGLLNEELENNPFLEDSGAAPSVRHASRHSGNSGKAAPEDDIDPFALLIKAPSLQEVLLRQLAVSPLTPEEMKTGQEIIGNIDDDGYLKASLAEISETLSLPTGNVETILKLIQTFEPAGVGARDIRECLLIQCNTRNDNDPLLQPVIERHLDDVAKRKFSQIAKDLGTSVANIELCVAKLTAMNPRPGQNYSPGHNQTVMPDIFIDEKDGALEIFINQENLPSLYINEEYRQILKNENLPPETREYLKEKLQEALELLRAISRRHGTLRKVLEVLTDIQKDALLNGLANMKPLSCREVAEKISMHESTVYRIIMNKYAETPQGIIALKEFFTSGIKQDDGTLTPSNLCKDRIKELIEGEDRKQPLSDEDLAGILLKENAIRIARRTVAKYREELKLPASSLRREH